MASFKKFYKEDHPTRAMQCAVGAQEWVKYATGVQVYGDGGPFAGNVIRANLGESIDDFGKDGSKLKNGDIASWFAKDGYGCMEIDGVKQCFGHVAMWCDGTYGTKGWWGANQGPGAGINGTPYYTLSGFYGVGGAPGKVCRLYGVADGYKQLVIANGIIIKAVPN